MRLRGKATLMFSAGMLVVAVTGVLLLSRRMTTDIRTHGSSTTQLLDEASRRGLEERALLLVRSLAERARDPVYKLEVAELDEMVGSTTETVAEVEAVEVLDSQARILSDGSGTVYLKNVVRRDPVRRRAAQSRTAGVRWESDRLVAWAPVKLGSDFLGAVWLEVNLESYKALLASLAKQNNALLADTQKEAGRQSLLVSGLALALAIVLGLAFATLLTRRITRIAGVAKRVGDGDLSVRVEASGKDEIGDVGRQFNRMLDEIARSRETMKAKERLEKELEVAQVIQTSVLPPSPIQAGELRIVGKMLTAEEVGGDYYDVVPGTNGCWLAIGDVSGHGLTSGLVMLMVQSSIASLTEQNPDASPSEVIAHVNRVLHENVRRRLRAREHMTLTLLRYLGDGRFLFAGAHEEMVVWRKDGQKCELVPTPGTWLGMRRDLGSAITDRELRLEHGDRLVLYTDGITEQRNAAKEQFGLDRFTSAVEKAGNGAESVMDAVLGAVDKFSPGRSDDQTIVVVERA